MWRWDQQEPFGINVPDENPSGLGAFEFSLRFPGQYADKETNLHYNYFRDYDSLLGRYIESDPIGIGGGLNTYSYVHSNPILFADPTGEAPPIIAAGLVLFGGYVLYNVVQGAVGAASQLSICVTMKQILNYAQAAFESCEALKRRGDGCDCTKLAEDLRRASEDYRISCVGGTTSNAANLQGLQRYAPRGAAR